MPTSRSIEREVGDGRRRRRGRPSPSGAAASRSKRPPACAPRRAARRRCSRTAASAGRRRGPARRSGRRRRAAPASGRGSRARGTRRWRSRPGTARPARPARASSIGSDVRAGSSTAMSPARHGRSAAVAVADRPALAQRGGDGAGDDAASRSAQLVGVDVVVVVLGGAEHAHRAVVARAPAGRRRAAPYAGWTPASALDDVAEHAVDPVDDGVGRAEVGRQRGSRSAPMLAGGGEVRGDVGPPEAVDRLLRVADDEQPAGQRPQRRRCRAAGWPSGVGGQADGDLELDRVGVLELVEQQPLVALVEAAPGRRRRRPAAGGPGRAGRGTRACRRRPGPRAPSSTKRPQIAPDDAPGGSAATSAQVVVDDVGDGDLLGAQRVERRRAAVALPVGLVARAGAACRGGRAIVVERRRASAPRSASRRRRAGERGRLARARSAWRSSGGTGVAARSATAGEQRRRSAAGRGGGVERRRGARRGPSWPGSPRSTRRRPRVPPNVPHCSSCTSSAAAQPGRDLARRRRRAARRGGPPSARRGPAGSPARRAR